jgi:hypothetical protein
MRTPEYLASQMSQSIAAKKDALIQETINKHYGFEVSLPFVMYLATTGKFTAVIVKGVETLYIEDTAILEIYPVEMVCTDDPCVVSFDFKYRSLI